MTTTLYASLLALLICWLSLNVIKQRYKHRVSIGDGDNAELITAMAAQSNAIEYIPIAVLLLFALEFNHAELWLLHLLGIAFIAGRLLHARSLLGGHFKGRVLGMQITIFTLIGLAILNLIYLPYGQLIRV